MASRVSDLLGSAPVEVGDQEEQRNRAGQACRSTSRTIEQAGCAGRQHSCSLNQATVSRKPSRTLTRGRYPSTDSAWRIEA